MDRYGSERIAGAIITATLIVVLAFVVWPEYKEYRMRRALAEQAAKLSVQADKDRRANAQRRQALERQKSQEAADLARWRILADDERCIGGAVVRVGKDGQGRPTFTQLSVRGRLVKCEGEQRR